MQKEESTRDYFEIIKSVESGSSKISAWSLSILGGSIGLIIGSAHITPENSLMRLSYFLFIIGWAYIGASLYQAREIIKKAMAAEVFKGNPKHSYSVLEKCNDLLGKQFTFFNVALCIFGVWLVCYLIWWVVQGLPVETAIESMPDPRDLYR